MTHVFIVPEPHIWDKNFENRINYPGEIRQYLAEVISQIKTCDGAKYILFPGDVFHRSYKSFQGLIDAIDLISELNLITDGHVYSCVGNHELSYAGNNPFWMMCHAGTKRYEKLSGLRGYCTIHPGIKVCDELAIGKTLFVFGHYNRTDYDYDFSKYESVIFITHNSVTAKEIVSDLVEVQHRNFNVEYMQTTDLRAANAIPATDKLKYMFVGHMHTAYSQFIIDENIQGQNMHFTLLNMGSLGRTSTTEVDDSDLVRTIPHFILDADNLAYEPFDINLLSRKNVILEKKVVEAHEKYESRKPVENLKKTNVFGSDPKDKIIDWISDDFATLDLFKKLLCNEPIADVQELISEAYTL